MEKVIGHGVYDVSRKCYGYGKFCIIQNIKLLIENQNDNSLIMNKEETLIK